MTVNGNDDLRNQLATVTAQLTRAREGLERIANQDYEVADDDPDDDEGLIGAMSADARATLAAISDTAPAAPVVAPTTGPVGRSAREVALELVQRIGTYCLHFDHSVGCLAVDTFKRSSVAVVEAAIAAESASLDGYPAHWPRKSHAVVAKRRLNPKVRRSQQSKERTT